MSRFAGLLNGTLSIGGAQAISRGALLVLFAAVARTLGADGLGQFAMLWTAWSLLLVLAEWGQQSAITREAARQPGADWQLAGRALAALGGPLVLAAGLFFAAGLLFPGASVWATLPLALALALQVGRNLAVGLARARADWQLEWRAALCDRALMLAAALAALAAGGSLAAVCWAIFAGQCAGCVAIVRQWRPTPAARAAFRAGFKQGAGQLRAQGAWLMLAQVAAVIYVRSDILILGAYADAAEVGAYSAVAALVMAFGMAPQVVLWAAYPDWVRAASTARATLRRPWLWLAPLAVGELLLGYFAGRWLVGLIFGLSVAAPLAVILWAAEAVNTLNYAGGQLLRAQNRERLLVALMGAAALFNLGANLLLIPRYGAMAAAATTLVAYAGLAVGHALAQNGRAVNGLMVSVLVALALCAIYVAG